MRRRLLHAAGAIALVLALAGCAASYSPYGYGETVSYGYGYGLWYGGGYWAPGFVAGRPFFFGHPHFAHPFFGHPHAAFAYPHFAFAHPHFAGSHAKPSSFDAGGMFAGHGMIHGPARMRVGLGGSHGSGPGYPHG